MTNADFRSETCNATADVTVPAGSSAPSETHRYQVVVVGGGLAGLCAALSSARAGVRTALIQDRAVLGGNASSEVRMWALGAHGADNRETGIMEEIRLANLCANPDRRFSVWDQVLYGLAREQEHLDLYLSSAVCELSMAGDDRIDAIRAWHLTRQCWLQIHAEAFIDCSGDSILRLSGAACRWGREAKSASGEPHAQDQADRRTMGNTILIQLREIDPAHHRPYRAPKWALPVDDETFPTRKLMPTGHNFWWLELGGEHDSIADADRLRDDLTALAHGVWAYIKNHPDGRGHAWELEWIGALPGKRENVRYEGDHILTEDDIVAEGRFEDLIAHGGWTMDDHPPAGIYHQGKATTHHAAPSPYGIPYRSLYSHNVRNLWFAGRNISATHMAMSSTRVMATCATLGQAAGSAAAIAIQQGCDNRGVYQDHLDRLQRRLLDQDQWLPARRRPVSPLTAAAAVSVIGWASADQATDPGVLTDGIDRRQDGDWHRALLAPGAVITFTWDQPESISRLRLTGDSKLSMIKTMPCSFPLAGNRQAMPATLPRDLRIEVSDDGTTWREVTRIEDNDRRLIDWRPTEPVTAAALRVVLERGWGEADDAAIGVFACEVGEPEPAGAVESFPWPAGVAAKATSGA